MRCKKYFRLSPAAKAGSFVEVKRPCSWQKTENKLISKIRNLGQMRSPEGIENNLSIVYLHSQFQSHLKETINFVELEIQAKLANLAKIKAMIGNKRKALAGVMITKDKLRADNLRLCQRCSLLRNKKLLQDFEKVKDACEDLQSQLDILKRQHEKLSVKCSTVKSKLKQSRPLQHCV
ncbi:hypothetical protein P4O66_005322 [Electrophorus voltai]|uniref:CCDC113/CCDC96 coiled-coil domain-containing protein n=1 Tax=Electrophorus voltai TaxID=2609070 RepID=A0AAD8ZX08_9TELE|nr:hypothetical protein P4O66_005322 [Electrophorus voltai]